MNPPADRPGDTRRILGQRAEQFVTASLERAGYTILDRNWRQPELGEIDIVARLADTIVFVEVRARRGPLRLAIEQALSSVDAPKQARLVALAEAYLAGHDFGSEVSGRIDVVAVGCQGDRLVMEVIRHAVDW